MTSTGCDIILKALKRFKDLSSDAVYEFIKIIEMLIG